MRLTITLFTKSRKSFFFTEIKICLHCLKTFLSCLYVFLNLVIETKVVQFCLWRLKVRFLSRSLGESSSDERESLSEPKVSRISYIDAYILKNNYNKYYFSIITYFK